MKSDKLLAGILAILLIVGGLYLFGYPIPGIPVKGSKEGEDDNGNLLPPVPAPTFSAPLTAPDPANPDDVTGKPVPLYSDSGEGLAFVETRATQLFKNASTRAAVIRQMELDKALLAGLDRPENFTAYLVENFGSLGRVPIYPPFMDGGQFIDQMGAVASLNDFNNTSGGRGREGAQALYRAASVMPDGSSFWNDESIAQAVHIGLWGPEERRDSDHSNRWDRFADDYKKFAANAVNAAYGLDVALKEMAINDLVRAGYNYVGYANV